MLMLGWVCWRNNDGERERGSKKEGVRVNQNEGLKKVKSYICMRPTTTIIMKTISGSRVKFARLIPIRKLKD